MSRFLAAVLYIAVCVGCSNSARRTPNSALDFSYVNTLENSFSMKFGEGDTVFLRQYQKYGLHPKNYISVIKQKDIADLQALINDIDLSKVDSTYPEAGIVDGSYYGLCITTAEKRIIFYPDPKASPPQIKNMIGHLLKMKKLWLWQATTRQVKFQSEMRIPNTRVKSDMEKFLP